MTHYHSSWDCLICGRETADNSRIEVCETCVRRLASQLCREMLSHPLGPGIDETYFMNRAYDYAETLFGAHANAKRRVISRFAGTND